MRTLIVSFLIIIPFFLRCQLEDYVIWFSERDGLNNISCEDIEFDPFGNILVGNHVGVCVFNGKTFVSKSKLDGLANSSIEYIQKDAFNRLWLFSYSDKLTLFENGKFNSIKAYNKKDYNRKTKYEFYAHAKNEFIVDYMHPFCSVYYQKLGGRWKKIKEVKTTFEGVKLRNPKNRNEFIGELDVQNTSNSAKLIFLFYKTKIKKVFQFPLAQYNFSKLNSETNTFFSFGKELFELDDKGIKSHHTFLNQIDKIKDARNVNQIWIYFENGILQKFRKKDMTVLMSFNLKGKGFNEVKEDLNENVWIGTFCGLGLYKPMKKQYYRKDKQLNSGINTLFPLNDTIFFGHNNGDIGYSVKKNDKVENEKIIYKNQPRFEFQRSCVNQFILYKNKIIAINRGFGVYEICRKTLKIKRVADFASCSVDFSQKENLLYFCNYPNGFTTYDGKVFKNKIIYDADSNKLWVNFMYSIKPNYYYIGNHEGLFILENGKIRSFSNSRFLGERIVAIKKYKEKFVFGTYGNGLVICDENDTLHLTTEQGLTSNFINSVMIDKNSIWLSTANGISLVDFSTNNNTYKIYTLPGKFCLNYDVFTIDLFDKYIITASNVNEAFNGGMMLIEKESFNTKSRLYPLTISAIFVNGKSRPFNKPLSVEYNEDNRLTFITSISTLNGDQPTYYFRLKGLSKKWRKSKNSSIDFTNLSPKNYVFEVFASSNNHRTSTIRYFIEITPLWYQNFYFIMVIVITLAIVILAVIQRALSRKREKQEIELALSNLEANVIRAQMNPHFVFNSLNSIQSLINTNENKKANTYLSLFSNLLRQTISISKKQNNSIEMEVELLTNYIEIEKMRSNDNFDYHIKLSEQIDPHTTLIPSMLLQPFVENAIIHGLNPLSEKRGQLTIDISKNRDFLICIIEDNGIGRKKAHEIKQNKMKYHVSESTQLVQTRMNIFSKMYRKKASINFEDLVQDENAIGTKVIIQIPLNYEKNY